MIPARAVPVYTNQMMKAVVMVFVSVLGCGGAEPKSSSVVPSGGAAGGPGDVVFEIPTVDIKGDAIDPEALGRPGMPLVEAKTKTTIEKQRAAYASAKDPVQKQAQAAILATLLYVKSKDAKPEAKPALLKDARDVLRDAVAAAGTKADELTLRMLGSHELLADDYLAAEKTWRALVANAPTDKAAVLHRAWWIYSLLRLHRNADVAAALADQSVSDSQPELAYVAAWAKWRGGDSPGAWQAMVAAAKGLASKSDNSVVATAFDREMLWFAGRSGPAFAEALAQLAPLLGRGSQRQYEFVAKLGVQSYPFAGRWADAISAIDQALVLGAGKVPASEVALLRYQQAEYTIRLSDPAAAAVRAGQALEALLTCGGKCRTPENATVIERAYLIGRLFHVLYATAHDDRYYQPAHDLYAAAIPMLQGTEKVREQALRDAANLEGSHRAMSPGVGAHDKAAVGALLAYRNQEVQACFERGLAVNPKLGGTLTVTLESDQTGTIIGAATEPPAGAADLAMVAGCVLARAKMWELPKRANGTGPAGVTRIKLSYSMAPTLSKP